MIVKLAVYRSEFDEYQEAPFFDRRVDEQDPTLAELLEGFQELLEALGIEAVVSVKQ